MPDVYGWGWMPHMPAGLLVWLATSPPRLWVYGLRSVHGVFRFFHLFGMAGFLGMLLLIEVKRLGFFRDASIRDARIPDADPDEHGLRGDAVIGPCPLPL